MPIKVSTIGVGLLMLHYQGVGSHPDNPRTIAGVRAVVTFLMEEVDASIGLGHSA
jgi:hypothetical protein